jgi:putative folate metabolism gamma-glutamate ligase
VKKSESSPATIEIYRSRENEARLRVHGIHTHKITVRDPSLTALLDRYVPAIEEGAILAITSKIVAITEGRVVPLGQIDKKSLILREADAVLAPELSKYDVTLTITRGQLVAAAGIDESNADGHFVLWPSDPQRTANSVRAYLRQRFGRQRVGVVITDSKTTPLRVGVTGMALSHSGFAATNDYVGQPDLFGRPLRMTQVNVLDGLATAAVLVMGEGSEQTPLAVLTELPFVAFEDHDPTSGDLAKLRIPLEDDLYAPLLSGAAWQKRS